MRTSEGIDDSAAAVGQTQPATRAPATAAVHHTNLFDLLRFGAALSVLWGHAYSLTGHAPPGWFGNAVGTLGVKVFFVISGLMITRSWLNDPRIWAFAARRILRIMPALILLTCLTIGVLGPLETSLPLGAYLRSSGTRFYLWNILLFPIYALPGVFTQNPYPIAVNGSLWSLPAEVFMYVLTPLIIGRTAWRGRIAIIVACAMLGVAGIYFVRIAPIIPRPVVYGTSVISVLDVAVYFQLGALFAVFALDRFSRPAFAAALLVLTGLAIEQIPPSPGLPVIAEFALMCTLPFAVISVGNVKLTGRLGRMLAVPDVSYGLYLYGFPVEQVISAAWHGHASPQIDFAIALPFTFGFALLSWHLVEKTALRLKPGRAASGVKKA